MKENIIFHIDVNNAFLSWTAVKLLKEGYNKDIRNIPSIIGGDEESRHGIVLAKSPVAKKYGIKTAETIYSAKKKCKDIEIFPPEHDYYKEISNSFMNYLSKYTPNIEQLSIDECFMDMSHSSYLYDDLIFLAYQIKEEVREKFGFTVNIGISTSKVLAKMASDMEKPNKVHTLFLEEIEKKMWNLPINELYMSGKSASLKLESIGIHTIGDLARSEKSTIEKLLGKHGAMLYDYSHGISNDIKSKYDSVEKSLSTSETFKEDIVEKNKLIQILYKQVDNLSKSLRKDKLYTYTIGISFKNSDFKTYSKQLTLDVPTNSIEEISKHIINIFNASWKNDPIRNMGIRFSNLTDKKSRQLSIFNEDKEIKIEKLQETMDLINDKYGESIIRQANLFTSPVEKDNVN